MPARPHAAAISARLRSRTEPAAAVPPDQRQRRQEHHAVDARRGHDRRRHRRPDPALACATRAPRRPAPGRTALRYRRRRRKYADGKHRRVNRRAQRALSCDRSNRARRYSSGIADRERQPGDQDAGEIEIMLRRRRAPGRARPSTAGRPGRSEVIAAALHVVVAARGDAVVPARVPAGEAIPERIRPAP